MRNPSIALTNVLNRAEECVAEYDSHLHSDEIKRQEEAQRQAQALADAKRLKEEQEAALAAEEAQKRELYAQLAKELGHPPPATPVIHVMVRSSIFIFIHLMYHIYPSHVLPVRHLERPVRDWRERHVSPVLGNMGPAP